MVSVGIDLVEVKRIEAAIRRYGDRFLTRVFTDAELEYCQQRPQALAARFAAKEAVAKVLGVGIQHRDGIGWCHMQVVSDPRGKPLVQLTGDAARRAGELGLHTFALSLSHTREHAIAIVVAE